MAKISFFIIKETIINNLIGCSNLDTVRKAAKFAVYDAIMMNPNSHHVAATKRPEMFFGASPPPEAD